MNTNEAMFSAKNLKNVMVDGIPIFVTDWPTKTLLTTTSDYKFMKF